jgi:hypothetical protein
MFPYYWGNVTTLLLKPFKQCLTDITSSRLWKSLYFWSVVFKHTNNFGSVSLNSLDHRMIILKTGSIFVCQCTVQYIWSVPNGINDTLRVSFEQWHSDCFVSAAFGTKSHSLFRAGCATISVSLLVLFRIHKSNRLLAVVDKYFRLWNSAVSTSLYMDLCFQVCLSWYLVRDGSHSLQYETDVPY